MNMQVLWPNMNMQVLWPRACPLITALLAVAVQSTLRIWQCCLYHRRQLLNPKVDLQVCHARLACCSDAGTWY
jgi:hypothetical protein